jgi:hypothetical protein
MINPNLPNICIPEDLALDNSPVLPDDGLAREPTPADAVRLWQEQSDHSTPVAVAVAAIVAKDPGCVNDIDIDDLEVCLTQALENAPISSHQSIQLARCHVAIRRNDYSLAMDLFNSLAMDNESVDGRRRCMELRVQILQGLGDNDEADRLHRYLRINDLLDAGAPSLKLRAYALKLFKERHCTEAERIYLHLVSRRFELGSTYCHLARVCLMLGRFVDAYRHLESAEQHCRERSYVRARTIFLRILQCYLNKRPTGGLLLKLRQTVTEPGAFEDWTMEPVIDYLRVNKRITADQNEVLMLLVKVLSSITNLPQLETISSLD